MVVHAKPEVRRVLTSAQVDVLIAINDYCEANQEDMLLDHSSLDLPDLLKDLQRPDAEVYQAVADLHELGLINGFEVAERHYPVRIQGLTATGRQELPSG
jgi:hypothetical protein